MTRSKYISIRYNRKVIYELKITMIYMDIYSRMAVKCLILGNTKMREQADEKGVVGAQISSWSQWGTCESRAGRRRVGSPISFGVCEELMWGLRFGVFSRSPTVASCLGAEQYSLNKCWSFFTPFNNPHCTLNIVALNQGRILLCVSYNTKQLVMHE